MDYTPPCRRQAKKAEAGLWSQMRAHSTSCWPAIRERFSAPAMRCWATGRWQRRQPRKFFPGFGEVSVHFVASLRPSTWVYAITRNACITAQGRIVATRTDSFDDPDVLRAAHRHQLGHPDRVLQTDVRGSMAELPEPQRQAPTLFYLEVTEPLGGVKRSRMRRSRLRSMRRWARSRPGDTAGGECWWKSVRS
jgi:hypothetical protein